MLDQPISNKIPEEKVELIIERLTEALVDYEDRFNRNFPEPNTVYHKEYDGYTVTFYGERRLMDPYLSYEDDEGVYDIAWSNERGIEGEIIQTVWK